MICEKDKRKRRRVKRTEFLDYSVFDRADIAKEKEKSRRLRNSSWWRKKISLGKCNYCRKNIPPGELTMDHIIPLSRGGRSERFNIVPACKDCNNKKRYLLPAEWEEYLDMIKSNLAEQE